MRLIDADALIDEVRSIWKSGSLDEYKSVAWKCALADTVILVLDVIARMLPIDAEPVRHGRWIRMDDTHTRWKCSECGFVEESPLFMRCHCGAKMDAKEETNAP